MHIFNGIYLRIFNILSDNKFKFHKYFYNGKIV